jgi:hypothetical protein
MQQYVAYSSNPINATDPMQCACAAILLVYCTVKGGDRGTDTMGNSTDRKTRVLTKGASVLTHWAIVLTGGAKVLTGGAGVTTGAQEH